MELVPGTVYLVGAGPGAADLITVRGLRVLRGATAVLYDALSGAELLGEVAPTAKLFPVGKRGYCTGSTSQDDINRLLVEQALSGEVVCRLKGGDPGVFSRGGEEMDACREAGVPVVVVPGVTAALGAAAGQGLVLTHRAVGRSLAFLTAHHDPETDPSPPDWHALARVTTLVIYMGVRHIAATLARLRQAGLADDTPARVVAAATTPREVTVLSTARDLAGECASLDARLPAVVIVGALAAGVEAANELAAREFAKLGT